MYCKRSRSANVGGKKGHEAHCSTTSSAVGPANIFVGKVSGAHDLVPEGTSCSTTSSAGGPARSLAAPLH
eukprot:scaffold260458_cov18-Tisochrysis_lutea.AAC.3